MPVPRTMLRAATDSTVEGLQGEYFAQPSFAGAPEMLRIDKELDFDWAYANPVPSLSADSTAQSFAVRWTGAIVPPAAETYDFDVRLPFCYPCDGKLQFAIYLDGKPLEPVPAEPAPGRLPPSGRNFGAIQHFAVPFADTRPHAIRIEYVQSGRIAGGGLVWEWKPRNDVLRDEAVRAAQKADLVVAFVGLTARLEGEEMRVSAKGFAGGDRTDIGLPDVQEELLEAVAKTGKPVVVVLLNGSALAVNWAAENARAILEAWYPGQSGGQAIAETLSGKNNPAGRLPVTFYTGIDQLPPFEDYAMSNRTYRYFKGRPLFAFGDGLSYTSFRYSDLKLSNDRLAAGEDLVVETDVENTGAAEGDEVAEAYLRPPAETTSPKVSLAGFARIRLAPGESKHLTFRLDSRRLSVVDEKGIRAERPGRYEISIGGSQPDGDAAQGVETKAFTIAGSREIPR